MWDDETPKPIGAIDHDGWSYIYYGPHIDYQADFNLMAFNFAQAANNFVNVANAVAADNAPTNLTSGIAIVGHSTWYSKTYHGMGVLRDLWYRPKYDHEHKHSTSGTTTVRMCLRQIV